MQNKRLESLDAFRGFDMMWIMGGSSIILSICAILGSGDVVMSENLSIGDNIIRWIASQMEHAQWHGLRFMDLIFPTFLFIAGISFPFSLSSQLARGFSKKQIHFRIIKRALILALLGLVSNGLLKSLDLSQLRFCSVLGRIGLAWMVGALLFVNTKRSVRIIVCASLLVLYYLLMRFCSPANAPIGHDPFSLEWNLAGYIDREILPGKFYLGTFDPEGLLGLMAASATAMLGMFTGEFLKNSKFSGKRNSAYMLLAALTLIMIGLIWSIDFPINKNLWSSSFTCVAGGLSLLGFTLFYYIIDVRGHKKWAFPFKVIGMNSITIYMAMSFINFYFTSKAILGGIAGRLPDVWGNLILVCGVFFLRWGFLYFLYKKKVFLKI